MNVALTMRCAWAACILLASLALVGCGDDAPEPAIGPEHPRAAIFLSLMERLPDLGNAVELDYADYAFARETFDIALPSPNAPVSDIRAYRDSMLIDAGVTAAGYIGGFRGPLRPAEWNAEIGFNVLDVDQEAHLFEGQSILSIVKGRFDVQKVEAAVRTDPAHSSHLEEHQRHGITYFAWLDDFERYPTPTAFRPHRVGGRLSVDDKFVLWAFSDHGIESMLDATVGDRDALSDSSAIRAIALAIDDLNIHRLRVSTSDYSMDNEQIRGLVTGTYGPDNVRRLEEDEGLLEPYQALAVGMGYDGTDQTAVLIYVYGTRFQAETNAHLLRNKLAGGISLASHRPWSELITASRIDVAGNAIHVSLQASPLLGINALNNLDGLILTSNTGPPLR